jgi:hypothetical protein
MIKKWIERRRLCRAFGRYLSPKAIDEALRQQDAMVTLHPKTIDIVLVAVRDDNPDDAHRLVNAVTNAAVTNDIFVAHILSPLVVLTIGMHPCPTDPKPDRLAFVEELSAEYGDSIRILHGVAQANIGNIGSSQRFSFSFLVPGFLGALAELANLSDGDVKEAHFKNRGSRTSASRAISGS